MKLPLASLERDDLLVPVHDGMIGFDVPSVDFVAIFEINDEAFGLSIFTELLPHADKAIGFECLCASEKVQSNVETVDLRMS